MYLFEQYIVFESEKGMLQNQSDAPTLEAVDELEKQIILQMDSSDDEEEKLEVEISYVYKPSLSTGIYGYYVHQNQMQDKYQQFILKEELATRKDKDEL